MIKRGITFNNIHSFRDLNLILSKANIPPAIPKTNYVDIPGGNGSVDLTEAHGEVKYSDRECEFLFTMNPSGGLSEGAFELKKTEVSNALNGLACRITLDKDPDYYYEGRCTVDGYQAEKKIRQIIVKARVKPYKSKIDETVIDVQLTEEAQTIILNNSRKTVIPLITCTDDNTTVIFNENTFNFSAGIHKELNIQLSEGENTVQVSGTGTITFTYQEGAL